MIYLILYDQRGQVQRVASTNSREDASEFVSNGFVEVDRLTYEEAAAIVPQATLDDLSNIQIATSLLSRINQNAARQVLSVVSDTRLLDRLSSAQRNKLASIIDDYLANRITLDQWYRRMVDAISAGNVAATVLAIGGVDNMTQDDRRQIETDNEIQLSYLARFRRDIDTLSPAQMRQRAISYAGAITPRYWTAHTRAQGLILPAMPGVRTSCGSNCKCNWDIRKLPGNGNWDCVWRISATESCPECLQREQTFSPLQVRNFIVQPFNPGGIYR